MNKKDIENKVYYSVSEFAKLLGLHRNTVRNYAKKGMIRFIQVGEKAVIRIPYSELDRIGVFNLKNVISKIKVE